MKNNVKDLIELLKRHQRGYNRNPSEYYYKLRDESKPITDIDRTARFIALNKTKITIETVIEGVYSSKLV